MSDYLVRMANQPALRNVIKTLGLPTPQELRRADGGYTENPMTGKSLLFGTQKGSQAKDAICAILKNTGAEITQQDTPESDPDNQYDALVFDATGLEDPGNLTTLYTFFNPVIRHLRPHGRVVIITDLPEAMEDTRAAVAARAVEGFMRSVGKEIGRKSATANLIYVAPDASDRLEGPVRFLLSPHSAYVDGQPIRVTARVIRPDHFPATSVLNDKVALVTGGARGIGAATARRLSVEGAHVVCLDIPADEQTLNETVQEFGGTALPMDITDNQAPRKIADFFKEKFGGVDIVIHNAGVTRDKTLANMDRKLWDMVLNINLLAILDIDEVLLGEKIIRDFGRVVCLSSIGGIGGNMGQTNYAATKAGLIGYVQSESSNQAGRGICMNAVAPGFIETRMTAEMPFMIREAGRRLCSLSQGGQPEDVAEMITFLSTPGAYGITGNVIRVCGQNVIGS